MEGPSFVAPGHLPLKRNYGGYPVRHPPQGYQHPPPGYQHPPPGYQHHNQQQPDQGYPPNQSHQPPRQEAGWMTPEIRAELQSRNTMRGTSHRSAEDHQAYQAQCEKVQHMIDESKAGLGIPSVASRGAEGPYASQSVPSAPKVDHHQLGQDQATLDAIATYYQNPSNYYSPASRKVHTCGPCNRTYFSKQKFDEHMKEHVECPFPECKLSAHIKIIDQHINNQHMLVNFANLQIDDEAWIAERKKRFPTSQRAELRRAAQLEKVKRGEKLGKSTKPFANNKNKPGKPQRPGMRGRGGVRGKESQESDNRRNRLQSKDSNSEWRGNARDNNKDCDTPSVGGKDGEGKPEERGGRGRFRQKRRERPAYPPRAHLDVDMFESDEDDDRLPAFKGTRLFYESTGELSYFGNKTLDIVDSDEEDMNAASGVNNLGISDDEEWPTEKKEDTTSSGGLVLGGALGSLMGAYTDSEEDETNSTPVKVDQDKSVATTLASNPTTNKSKADGKDDKCGPANAEKPGRPKNHKRPRHHKKGNGKVNKPVALTRRFPRRRKTLLEKLLLPDIIHERNVILQCVRYIVGKNFFDKLVENEGDASVEEGRKVVAEEKEVERDAGDKDVEMEEGRRDVAEEKEVERGAGDKDVETEEGRRDVAEEKEVERDAGDKEVETEEGRRDVAEEKEVERGAGDKEVEMEEGRRDVAEEKEVERDAGDKEVETEEGRRNVAEEKGGAGDKDLCGRTLGTEERTVKLVEEEMEVCGRESGEKSENVDVEDVAEQSKENKFGPQIQITENSAEPEIKATENITKSKNSNEPQQTTDNSTEPQQTTDNSTEPQHTTENSIKPQHTTENSIKPQQTTDNSTKPQHTTDNSTEPQNQKTEHYTSPENQAAVNELKPKGSDKSENENDREVRQRCASDDDDDVSRIEADAVEAEVKGSKRCEGGDNVVSEAGKTEVNRKKSRLSDDDSISGTEGESVEAEVKGSKRRECGDNVVSEAEAGKTEVNRKKSRLSDDDSISGTKADAVEAEVKGRKRCASGDDDDNVSGTKADAVETEVKRQRLGDGERNLSTV